MATIKLQQKFEGILELEYPFPDDVSFNFMNREEKEELMQLQPIKQRFEKEVQEIIDYLDSRAEVKVLCVQHIEYKLEMEG